MVPHRNTVQGIPGPLQDRRRRLISIPSQQHLNTCMDYYCTSKFTELQVHVQGRLLNNCCKAYPERISIDWLESNPGKLFHTDTMIADRKLMLDNKSCASCHHGCYKYEEQGQISKRQREKNDANEFIKDLYSPVKTLQLVLSTDCNLTCMYCGPHWSTSWQRDIDKNGEYKLDGLSDTSQRTNNNWIQLWSKMKQKSRGVESKFFQLLLKEIKLSTGLEKLVILGGEPLLNIQLDQVLEKVPNTKINIVTGLGVSNSRLVKVLEKIKGMDVQFSVSGEATGQLFELIRHGITWKDFQDRVEMIAQHGHQIKFLSTISNLSVLGFLDFYERFSDKHTININPLTETEWMMPHVLDPASKDIFIKETKTKQNLPLFGTILQMIKPDVLDKDRINMRNYIDQFASRHSVDLNFLPRHFINWCRYNPN